MSEMTFWLQPLRSYFVPIPPHPGAFGVQRKHDMHTGVDLYTKDGTSVYAVEDGIVVAVEHFTGEWDGTPWWNNTDCVLVEGKSGVVCYGEIVSRFKVGDVVSCGDRIATVVRVLKEDKERPDIAGHRPSMLHIELYRPGTRKPATSLGPEVLDPTSYLEGAMSREELHCEDCDGCCPDCGEHCPEEGGTSCGGSVDDRFLDVGDRI
jgi:hypothetical protein